MGVKCSRSVHGVSMRGFTDVAEKPQFLRALQRAWTAELAEQGSHRARGLQASRLLL